MTNKKQQKNLTKEALIHDLNVLRRLLEYILRTHELSDLVEAPLAEGVNCLHHITKILTTTEEPIE